MKIIDVIIEKQDFVSLPSSKEQKEWLSNLGDQLKGLDDIKQFSMMCQCKILYWVRHHWDNIDNEVKGFWQYDFYNWATTFTQNDSITNPASSTIDNKINVYKDYIAEPCIVIPDKVKVRKLDETGNVIGDGTLEEHYEEIEPDLMWGNYTKLLHAKKPAKEGLMTDKLWSMVFDQTQSVSELLKKIKNISTSDYYIIEKDGLLIGYNSDGRSAVLAEINFDDSQDEIWCEGIARLLKPYNHTVSLNI